MVRDYLKWTCPRCRVGLIHRLDRDASGLLVFSKNADAYKALKSQFFRHSVTRIYHALVQGVPQPPRGRIESRLVELPTGKVQRTRDSAKGQQAITDYEVISSAAGKSLVRLRLHTGRKHQIRAHMAQLNHPIIGDRVYNPSSPPSRGLLLAATHLGFNHPRTDKPVLFELPLMREFSI
jgi:23S rRNA pseudouridine1911/1915/1917 synthase